MSDFLIFKAAFNNSATPAIGTYTAEGATASFTQDASLSPDYYLYNPNASITAVKWFVPTKETTDFEFVADILTDDQAPDGDRYLIIAEITGTTGLCMLSSSTITEWRFMNSDSTATSDPEYVGAIDPTTSGGFGVFHQFRVRVRKLTASSSSVEVYVDGALTLTATAGAALVTCAKIGFIGGVTGSPSTSAGIQNVYVYDLSGRELVDRGVLSEGFNRLINWAKNDSGFISSAIKEGDYDNEMAGWCLLYGDLLIQWGSNTGAGSQFRITFAKPFSRLPLVTANYGDTSEYYAPCTIVAPTVTTTNFEVAHSGGSGGWRVNWIAIGKGA